MTAAEIWQNLHKTSFYTQCLIPLGYTAGLPALHLQEKQASLSIPYLRYQMTGAVDKTLVFPPRFLFRFEWPSARITGFWDLAAEEKFRDVDFDTPLGLFRHESVRHMDRSLYRRKRSELLELSEKLLSAAKQGKRPDPRDEEAFRLLYNIMLEPFLKPLYREFAPDFSQRFLL